MARRGKGEGHIRRRADSRWEARLSVGPRGQRKMLSGYGTTQAQAWDDLQTKVDAYNRRIRIGDAATWTVHDFLAWWLEVELPEKVADGKNAATTLTDYE